MPAMYDVTDEQRAKGVEWPIPRGQPGDHFTTWSAAAGVFVTVLVLITLPWMRAFRKTQKVASFTVVSLAIAAMAWIVCTTMISQNMFSFNTNIPESKHRNLAVGVKFVQKMLKWNFQLHVLPLILVVVLGLAITFMPAPSTLLGKGTVFLTSFLYFCMFVLAWLLTPATVPGHTGSDHSDAKESEEEKDKNGDGEGVEDKKDRGGDAEVGGAPKRVIGWEKIMYVYRSPNPHNFTIIFPLVALLVLVVGNFAVYGALDPRGMRCF